MLRYPMLLLILISLGCSQSDSSPSSDPIGESHVRAFGASSDTQVIHSTSAPNFIGLTGYPQLNASPGPDRVGNGGDIVVCLDSSSEHHLTLLDTYELRRVGKEPKFGNKTQWKLIVEDILSRWEEVSRVRMSQYQKWLESFEQEAFFGDNTIGDIPDHGNIILPRGCEIRQVAMQRPDEIIFPGVTRYEVDLEYWGLMNEFEKAALVLHELILREAINEGHQVNSIPTRFLNGFLLSEEPNPYDYFRAFVVAGFPYVELGFGGVVRNGSYNCHEGNCYWSDRVELSPSGVPVGSVHVNKVTGPISFKNFYCEPDDDSIEKGRSLGTIGFFEDWSVKAIENIRTSCKRSNFKLETFFGDGRLWSITPELGDGGYFLFRSFKSNENGFLSAFVHRNDSLKFTTDDASIVLNGIPDYILPFELPDFGLLPAFESHGNYLFFSTGMGSFIKTKSRLFDQPQAYRKCWGTGDSMYLVDNDTNWHFDNVQQIWVDGFGCKSN